MFACLLLHWIHATGFWNDINYYANAKILSLPRQFSMFHARFDRAFPVIAAPTGRSHCAPTIVRTPAGRWRCVPLIGVTAAAVAAALPVPRARRRDTIVIDYHRALLLANGTIDSRRRPIGESRIEIKPDRLYLFCCCYFRLLFPTRGIMCPIPTRNLRRFSDPRQ